MRIAFVVADYPSTSETFIARQIKGMVAMGHDVTVLAGRHRHDIADPLGGRVPIRSLRLPKRSVRAVAGAMARGVASPQRWRRLRAVAVAARHRCVAGIVDIAVGTACGRFDVVLAHFGPTGVRAQLLRDAGLLEGPLAVVFHGKDMSDRWTLAQNMSLYRQLFRTAELLLPISVLWRERLIAWGARPDRTLVMRMGVDLPPGSAVADDRPFHAPLRVLSVARLVEKKGIGYAIEGVKRAGAAIRYRVIGDGPLEVSLGAAAASGGNAVEMLGKQPHEAVFAALAGSDVFLLPSVTAANGDMEGIPVALMEAMAAGVLVIATRHSGTPELIRDGIDGLLVDERDADGIARALDRIASGAIDRVAMRRAARATVAARFNNAILDPDLERVLQTIAVPTMRVVPSSMAVIPVAQPAS